MNQRHRDRRVNGHRHRDLDGALVTNTVQVQEVLVDAEAKIMLDFLVDNLDHVRTELPEADIDAACDALFPGASASICLAVPVERVAAACVILADFASHADETAAEHKAMTAAGDWVPCAPEACLRAANACRIALRLLESNHVRAMLLTLLDAIDCHRCAGDRMSANKLSVRQFEAMREVMRVRPAWYRARTSGERVTLAALWRGGVLERRARRGTSGASDAAHEYRPSASFLAALKDTPP